MTRLLLASVAILAAGNVYAADLLEPIAPPIDVVSSFSWSGAYIGVQGGGLFARIAASGFGESIRETVPAGYVGGFTGYNIEVGNGFVLGIEGDVAYTLHHSAITETVGSKNSWSYGARARSGYAFDQTLLFVSGGLAVNRLAFETPRGKAHKTVNGWSVGAGVDQAFTEQLFGRLEYRYADFQNQKIDGLNIDLKQHTVGAAIGIKF